MPCIVNFLFVVFLTGTTDVKAWQHQDQLTNPIDPVSGELDCWHQAEGRDSGQEQDQLTDSMVPVSGELDYWHQAGHDPGQEQDQLTESMDPVRRAGLLAPGRRS